MYLVLSFSLIKAQFEKKLNLSKRRLYIGVIAVGISFGYCIELVQEFYIYQRCFEYADIVANSIGTIFGVILAKQTGIKIV